MKEPYEPLQAEIIRFDSEDVIITSGEGNYSGIVQDS